MKFEREKNGSYFVNDQYISKRTLNAIFGELFLAEAWQRILDELKSYGRATVSFEGKNTVLFVPDANATLGQERRKNQLLEAKLTAVEKEFLEIQSA